MHENYLERSFRRPRSIIKTPQSQSSHTDRSKLTKKYLYQFGNQEFKNKVYYSPKYRSENKRYYTNEEETNSHNDIYRIKRTKSQKKKIDNSLPKFSMKNKQLHQKYSIKMPSFMDPTVNSTLQRNNQQMQLRNYNYKRLCSVDCLKSKVQKKKSKMNKIAEDLYKDVDLRDFLYEESKCKNQMTQLQRYLKRLQNKKKSQLLSKQDKYQTYFGVQPQFYKLKTQYAKQILNQASTSQQQITYNRQQKTNIIQIPNIPRQQDLHEYIEQYQIINKNINLVKLFKSKRFLVQYSPNQLYFGQMQDNAKQGTGILITKSYCYQGQFKNDKKIKGLQLNDCGVYNGQYYNNQREGSGQFQWFNGEYYIGEWVYGQRHGKGVWTNKKGDSYNGEWYKGKAQGKGTFISINQQYKGQFIDSKKEGWGKEIFYHGDKYKGHFKKGVPHGKGRYKWRNGTIYQGQFINGLRSGKGHLESKDGYIYKGQFVDEKAEGLCQIFHPNGDKYQGYLRNGKKNGRGVVILQDNKIILDGLWQDDVFIDTIQI